MARRVALNHQRRRRRLLSLHSRLQEKAATEASTDDRSRLRVREAIETLRPAEFVLVDTPAPQAVRAALFKVEASIPGVTVVGRYTDPLGRTGIALRLGRSTIVVNPVGGAVIDDIESGSAVMYVTQGPVGSEPKLAGSCRRTCQSRTDSGTAPTDPRAADAST